MNPKNILKTLGTGLAMFALTACGDVGRPTEVSGPENGEKIMTDSKNKTLVVYFTRSGRTRQVAHDYDEFDKHHPIKRDRRAAKNAEIMSFIEDWKRNEDAKD